MRLTTKGQYAVRALVMLMILGDDGPVTLKEISDAEDISLNYLEQLFSKMRKGKIVKSIKGPGGGYILARNSEEIKVGEIIEVVEESISPVACVDDGAHAQSCCVRSHKCTTQWLWAELGARIKDFLNSVTIQDLYKEAKKKGVTGDILDDKEGLLGL
ncbi:MAG: Rrf2 family transcriptional regulator [Deltaproteobacteria bacterium]|uniref:Rrf2 family transcriptional regulator n=1 Tax=Candidatus Zymogenus saltonus TaxID=2844893 RepID=A0A9D8KGM5_9DELT|nr:Rrf2 family transcriptional regulator [Candidatus Zymogenus saltonus]